MSGHDVLFAISLGLLVTGGILFFIGEIWRIKTEAILKKLRDARDAEEGRER